jgi:predicted RNA-binding Zn-ribbon protein involved in translation (DUF1610 family)
MASDLIYREDAKDFVRHAYHKGLNLVDYLDEVPAADVRPVVRGKWLKYAPDNSDMMTCSECEKYWILDGDQYDYHFCPNCGADMREQGAEGGA